MRLSGWPLESRGGARIVSVLIRARAPDASSPDVCLSLVLGDLVKLVWGGEYKSVPVPTVFQGLARLFGGLPFPVYNVFLLIWDLLSPWLLWLLVNKTRIGKIARAAAVDREMVGAVGINVSWLYRRVFVIGCLLAGLGGVLVAPTASIALGMDAPSSPRRFSSSLLAASATSGGPFSAPLFSGLPNRSASSRGPSSASFFPTSQ